MEPVGSVAIQSLVPTLPHTLSEGCKVRWYHQVGRKLAASEFVVGWQIQARLSNPTLVVLIAALPLQLGMILLPLVALGWGMAACSYYEYRRRHGVTCLYRDPQEEIPGQTEGRKRYFWGWCGYLLKVVFILGAVNVLTTKALCRLNRRYRSCGEVGSLGARITLVIGIGKSGVMAARHFLEQAGYPKKKIYQLNLLGRVLEVPFKMADAWVLYAVYLVLPFPNIAGLPLHGLLWLVSVVQLVITGGWF